MSKLASIRIGKKMARVLGGAMLMIASVAGLGIRSLHSVEATASQSQLEERYTAVLTELQARVGDREGRRLMDTWQEPLAAPRAANFRVTVPAKAGRPVEAGEKEAATQAMGKVLTNLKIGKAGRPGG